MRRQLSVFTAEGIINESSSLLLAFNFAFNLSTVFVSSLLCNPASPIRNLGWKAVLNLFPWSDFNCTWLLLCSCNAHKLQVVLGLFIIQYCRYLFDTVHAATACRHQVLNLELFQKCMSPTHSKVQQAPSSRHISMGGIKVQEVVVLRATQKCHRRPIVFSLHWTVCISGKRAVGLTDRNAVKTFNQLSQVLSSWFGSSSSVALFVRFWGLVTVTLRNKRWINGKKHLLKGN